MLVILLLPILAGFQMLALIPFALLIRFKVSKSLGKKIITLAAILITTPVQINLGIAVMPVPICLLYKHLPDILFHPGRYIFEPATVIFTILSTLIIGQITGYLAYKSFPITPVKNS